MAEAGTDVDTKEMRIFVAAALPAGVCADVAAWARGAEAADPVLRAIPEHNLHVTLAFLGNRDGNQAAAVAAILKRFGDPLPVEDIDPEPVAVGGGRPALFAFELISPAMIALQGTLAGELAAARLYEPGERPFWPHLTALRVRRERGRRRPARVRERPGRLEPRPEHPFGAVRLALYRSDLRPDGAHYTSLTEVELPPIAGGR